ncbi:putative ADP-ribosylation factor GTPase-activating protein AGD14 [Drosera capensis]
MGSRFKEDEKNEKIIRGLLKLPANRRCINCNSLGPQYVCTTFATFVCTICSGIHREFTHRVKSVSMAKFTPQEVSSLQTGGNERAREIYFKEWDSQKNSSPDSNNVDRLRDFIKHVYVDRRHSGGARSSEGSLRSQMGDKEAPSDNKRTDGYQSGSRSPPYEDTQERRYSDRSSNRSSPSYGGRSPGNDLDSQQHNDYGRSPVRGGVVNDWRREDRFSNGRKSESQRSFDGDPKPGVKSPEHQKNNSISSSPVVRPVRDILGDNVIPLRISEPPKSGSGRVADGSVTTQRTASSSSLASSNGNPVELKREESLIDFDADPEPPVASVTPAPQSAYIQPAVNVASAPNNDNWAFFDNASHTKVSQVASTINSLESQLSWSVPPPASGPSGSLPSVIVATASSVSAAPVRNLSPFPYGAPTYASVNSNNAQWNSMQPPQRSLFGGNGIASNSPQVTQSFPLAPNGQYVQGSSGNHAMQAAQGINNPSQPSLGFNVQKTEVKSGGRKELPQDLFAAIYPPFQAAPQGWHGGVHPGMGYGMHYNPSMYMPSFGRPNKPANPFDVANEASPAPVNSVMQFPAMSSLQAALPNAAPSGGLMRTSSLPQSWTPSQSSSPYLSPPQPLAPQGASVMPPGPPAWQQGFSNQPPSRTHSFGGFGNEGAPFGSFSPAPNIGGQFSAAPAGNSSLSGNPFG